MSIGRLLKKNVPFMPQYAYTDIAVFALAHLS